MAQIDDLNTAVTKLQTDVAALIAAGTVTAPDSDLQANIDALNALDAQVVAATPVATGTPPVAAAAKKANPTLG